MEYSLTSPDKKVVKQFEDFLSLIEYLQGVGEVDGWILRIHHM